MNHSGNVKEQNDIFRLNLQGQKDTYIKEGRQQDLFLHMAPMRYMSVDGLTDVGQTCIHLVKIKLDFKPVLLIPNQYALICHDSL